MTRIADIKTLLDITDNSQDAKLTLIIAAIESTVEGMTGYKVTQAEITEELNGLTERKLLLKWMPVKTVTSVSYWNSTTEAWEVVDSDLYELDGRLGEIIFANATPRGVKNIKVVYTAGDDTLQADINGAINDYVIQRFTGGGRGISSESVDGASVTYADPKEIVNHPVFSQYIRV